MPRRLSSPFSSNSSTSNSPSSSDRPTARPTSSSGGGGGGGSGGSSSSSSSKRLSHYLWPIKSSSSSSSTNISSPPVQSNHNLPLPIISLSSSTGASVNMDEKQTTLFKPPTTAETQKLAKEHAQFGPLLSPQHRHVSQHADAELPNPIEDSPPYWILLTTYFSYLILIGLGHIEDFFGKRWDPARFSHLQEHNGYAPLVSDFESFYIRRLKQRIEDCFARPTTGVPGRYINLVDRKSDDFNETFHFTGTTTQTLNVSSYNYLGFAQSEGPCADYAEEITRKYGVSTASTRALGGTSDLHVEAENLVAKFVGKESAVMFSMGFATNAGIFPALVSRGSLIISDELNHASIRNGARLSGAMIESFKHNDMADLEKRLRRAIAQGQPRTHRPWRNILVAIEGLYSMEGDFVNLPGVCALRRKYKFHLFMDEAHSIGAVGPHGRGVCDYFGVDPSEVDILMGTFTKSFGANGGYVAADKKTIDKLKLINAGTVYSEAPTPYVLAQIISSMRIISGELMPGEGAERMERLAFNSRYLRLGLKRLGFIVYGHDDSPVIPLMTYNPGKMPAFSREMLRRKISVVVVAYPATPLVLSRVRFCVSAAHNKEDLDRLLTACDEIGDAMQLRFSSGVAGGAHYPEGEHLTQDEVYRSFGKEAAEPPRWKLSEVIRRGVQDTKFPLR